MSDRDDNITLDELLPYGMLATRQWLLAQGLGLHTLDNAVKSKKLVALANGVYARTGVPVSWEGVVCSLQRMSKVPYHVGGLTALEYQGLGHYASLSEHRTLYIYSDSDLPGWIKRIKHEAEFIWRGTRRLWTEEVMSNDRFVKTFSWNKVLPPVLMSCPEKAYLEMLMDVPDKVSFEHAEHLMQGMTTLSPIKLEALLTSCKNVKVKRLFFWLAEKRGYAWFSKLDPDRFDLGSGKRVIAKNGRLDKKYLITVPEYLDG